MEKKNIDDITFKLLANPIRFRKDKNDIPTDDDDLFLKIIHHHRLGCHFYLSLIL